MAGNNHNGSSRGCVVSSDKDSKVRKTSGWRTFRPIFTDKCRGCGICVQYCPEGCIELRGIAGGKKLAKVNYDYCKGCLLCMSLCPFKAIDKELEK
jgi:pyruvate ferredoxin oxidoreductase delta subunit